MAGVKGRSGKQNDRPWTEALRVTVNHLDAKGKRRLLRIAERTVRMAEAGDISAIKEIGDRLEGKPAQESVVTFEKRDASDWSRDELVALINDTVEGGEGTGSPDRCDEQPDQFH